MTDSVKVRNPRGLWVVNADYMQQLERENTALRKNAERLAEALETAVTREYRFINDTDEPASKEQIAFLATSEEALTLYRAENPKV